jgi:Predicted membrane protein
VEGEAKEREATKKAAAAEKRKAARAAEKAKRDEEKAKEKADKARRKREEAVAAIAAEEEASRLAREERAARLAGEGSQDCRGLLCPQASLILAAFPFPSLNGWVGWPGRKSCPRRRRPGKRREKAP